MSANKITFFVSDTDTHETIFLAQKLHSLGKAPSKGNLLYFIFTPETSSESATIIREGKILRSIDSQSIISL